MAAVLHNPLIEPQVARALRARCVRESGRFFLRDARGHGRYRYTVRSTGQVLTLEHGSPDIATFDQAFYQNAFAPPGAATARLEGLGRPLRALDVGANIGMFSIWLGAHHPLAHVTALEPLPRNVRALERNLELALPAGTFAVLAAAAGTHDGTVRFGGGDAATGRVRDDNDDGLEVPLRDVFGLVDGVDLLKLDIEGAEWPILADARFTRVAATVVMLEHHPHGAPSDPAAAAEAALRDAGYATVPTADGGDGTGVVWGVRG